MQERKVYFMGCQMFFIVGHSLQIDSWGAKNPSFQENGIDRWSVLWKSAYGLGKSSSFQ